MRDLTVKQLAKASGVSIRTLHHYDDVGLLRPARIGSNGYRYYGRAEMLRLQQILFLREFGFALQQIRELIDEPVAARIERLTERKAAIAAEAKRQRLLVRTIERAIAELQGETTVKTSDLYRGFSPQKQARYEAELVDRFGPKMRERIEQSKRNVANLDLDERTAELQEVEQALAARMRNGVAPEALELEPLLERHRAWVASMWGRPCPRAAYAHLTQAYEHRDFRARYEAIGAGFGDFLIAAMKAHAAREPA